MKFQLFLADADDHDPVLDDGIALDTTLDAPPPVTVQLDTQRAAKLEGVPDALVDQQWALVAPKGSLGDRLLELVAPLRRRREEEQGQEALVYRVDPGMIGRTDYVEDRQSKVRRANLWMQRQDLGAYVLLGDPAARLPIARPLPGVVESPHVVPVSEDAERRAEAVLAVLRGTTTASAVAKRLGVSRDEIEQWVGRFVDAGRAALGK